MHQPLLKLSKEIRYMSDNDGETTVLTAATTQSKSLRTTIPAGIVRQFSLTDGNKIQWKMDGKGQ